MHIPSGLSRVEKIAECNSAPEGDPVITSSFVEILVSTFAAGFGVLEVDPKDFESRDLFIRECMTTLGRLRARFKGLPMRAATSQVRHSRAAQNEGLLS